MPSGLITNSVRTEFQNSSNPGAPLVGCNGLLGRALIATGVIATAAGAPGLNTESPEYSSSRSQDIVRIVSPLRR